MSTREYMVKVGKKYVTATPAGKLIPVDFALGIVNGEPYIGFWEDVDLIDDNGEQIGTDTIPLLIFKDKTIVYEPVSLRQYGMKRTTTPVVFDNWWSGTIVDVNPKEYYEEVYSIFKYYIDAPEKYLHFMSLWTIGTIFHILFQAYPYMYLGGVKRSGKTKVLTLVKLLGFNGIRSHSMSEATIYRLVESGKATLLLDEQDYLANPERRAEFRALLLGGYKKGSFVYRSEKTSKGKIVPTRFQIYSPKALANIEGLEDVLADRTITITMMRSTDPNITRREPDENDPKFAVMRDKLASLFLNYANEVMETYNAVLRALGDTPDLSNIPERLQKVFAKASEQIYARVREIWSPIIALALFFEKHGVQGLVEKIVDVACENVKEREIDEIETPEAGLVMALCRMYTGDGYYALSDIADKFIEETGVQRIDPRSVGRMMKRLGLKDKIKRGGKIHYYLTASRLLDLCKRLSIYDLEEFPFLRNPPQTPKTQQTPLLDRAIKWCLVKKEFTREELAGALLVNDATADEIIRALIKDGLIIQAEGGLYRTTK